MAFFFQNYLRKRRVCNLCNCSKLATFVTLRSGVQLEVIVTIVSELAYFTYLMDLQPTYIGVIIYNPFTK